jgi:tetrahydromethanopterin S-methyltransferase subunit H
MHKFNVEQKVYDIAGVKIGGHIGERPTVLIGSIFFSGHRIVSDSLKGVFDKDKARELLERADEAAARTCNPHFIDVIGDTGPALIKYIEFVAAHSKAPILVDSFSQQVRLEALRHFAGSEIIPRLIYNSIAEDYTEEELDCLRECKVRSSVILAFSTTALKPKSRIKLFTDKLLPAAEKAGVENMLIDLGVLDIPSVAWTALAIREIKDTLGYPAGCAPSNALYTWEKLREQGQPTFEAAAGSIFTFTPPQGANFLFYGPIRNAPWVFTAVATVDAVLAYANRFTGVRLATDDHPLFKMF